MGDTKTTCSKCSSKFDPKENKATKNAGSFGAAILFGLLGSKFGIAGGILGLTIGKIAIIPAAILGLFIGLFLDTNIVICPDCDKIQFY